MSLRTYRKKRDFTKTPEPAGPAKGAKTAKKRARREEDRALSFVIQQHDATRMHHDFRLELDGVLKSWAVPKGPPTRPGEKVLAVRTEDHPLDYGGFEGVIPEGEYGAGAVMLWDRGTWRPEGNARKGIAEGKLSFELAGDRLNGRWSLVRMAPRSGRRDVPDKKEEWLLIKRTDRAKAARSGRVPKKGTSVATGRTLARIARDADRAWTADGERSPKPKRDDAALEIDPSQVARAVRRKQPAWLAPQLATLVAEAPDGGEWLHEMKFDGYRILAFKKGDRVRLLSRTQQDWTDHFPRVVEAIATLPVDEAILDTEACMVAPDGRTSFQALQNRAREEAAGYLAAFAFDLPFCGGFDLTGAPLIERKRLLEALLAAAPGARSTPKRRSRTLTGVLHYSEHVTGGGPAFRRACCERGLEGVVSKRADALYRGTRTKTWLKAKCLNRQEFVIGGWSEPAGSRESFGALLLGVYEAGGGGSGRGERGAEKAPLRYAGRVGTGFTRRSLAEIERRLAPLETDASPFVDPPRGAEAAGVHWIAPEVVAEVAFTEWTGDGHLRHPSFQGLRDDKDPREIVRERPREAAPAEKAPPKRRARRESARKPAKTRKPAAKSLAPAPRARPAATSAKGDAEVAGVRLSNPGRVLYPEQGITKRELAEYYAAVAEHVVPHVAGRPLTLVRCPRGRGAACFYQKHLTDGMPAPVRAVRVPEKKGSADYVAVDDLEGIVTLVQFGALEFHPWGSRADRPDLPDRIVLDLDPGEEVSFDRVIQSARRLGALLSDLGLVSFPRTTGGKGLHVVLPIARRASWAEVKTFALDLVTLLSREDESAYVLTASKALRRGRIFLDYLRNDRGSTAIASWSSRAREGAPVAMPLRWEEVAAGLEPRRFTVRTAPGLLAKRGDPWRGFFDVQQALTRDVRARVSRVQASFAGRSARAKR